MGDSFEMNGLNDAVAAILGKEQRAKQVREAPRKQRKEIKRQQARHRVHLELDELVAKTLRMVSEKEGVSPAAAANLLLARAIADYAGGEDFRGHLEDSPSPRWQHTITLGELASVLENLAERGFCNPRDP